ncbi:MAG TPA: hypothetical protein VFT78_10265 [Hanamia sp.]|nr:hypothetical protein [Hanamia sp.]
MFCNPDPNNHERAGQFEEMKMAAKINNVISDIKKYKPTYYLEFKKDFDGLEEFRRIRNDMSHCKGDFVNEPDDLSEFRVTYVDKHESGKEGMKFTIYSEQFIEQSLDRLATINGNLSALWLRLSKEYNSDSNPFVYRGFEAGLVNKIYK